MEDRGDIKWNELRILRDNTGWDEVKKKKKKRWRWQKRLTKEMWNKVRREGERLVRRWDIRKKKMRQEGKGIERRKEGRALMFLYENCFPLVSGLVIVVQVWPSLHLALKCVMSDQIALDLMKVQVYLRRTAAHRYHIEPKCKCKFTMSIHIQQVCHPQIKLKVWRCIQAACPCSVVHEWA